MNKRKVAVWAVTLLVIALIAWKLHASHFDWVAFWRDCRSADWRLLLLAVLVIYTNFFFRAARWALFLKPSLAPEQRIAWFRLVPSQFIGFTGLAILGRIGELIRPYLVSRRTGLPFSSQLAVVAVERIFDLAAFGILFGGNLLLSHQLNTLPYHEKYHLFGYAILGIIVFLSLFVVFIRVAGEGDGRHLRQGCRKDLTHCRQLCRGKDPGVSQRSEHRRQLWRLPRDLRVQPAYLGQHRAGLRDRHACLSGAGA